MGSYNLLALCPDHKDATSFYRGLGPLTHLRKTINRDIRIQSASTIDWAAIAACDGVFLQRPFTEQHVQVANMIRAQKIPIWVDYDDDLFSVPEDNPTFHVYGNPKTQKNVAELIAMADIVTVSTEHLKRQFQLGKRQLNKNIKVIPNAFNNRIIRNTEKYEAQDLILWRGSPTHAKDLATHLPGITSAFYKHTKFTWCFVGPRKQDLWFVADALKLDKKRAIFIDAMDPIKYFDFIRAGAAKIQIVPLDDSVFNRSKSNIAWMEASYAGSASLVPDWEEWNRPGAFRYKTPDDFGVCLDQMIGMANNLHEPARQSWEYIEENLMIDKVNKMREAVLAELSALSR